MALGKGDKEACGNNGSRGSQNLVYIFTLKFLLTESSKLTIPCSHVREMHIVINPLLANLLLL